MDIEVFLRGASVWVLPVLLAVTLHEAAHAYVAKMLGDDTASKLGRVSLNPVKHIDPFGTILLPSMLILFGSPFVLGWAKPVPVAFGRLRNPKRDMIFVAIAGPISNLLIALVAAIGMWVIGGDLIRPVGWLDENFRNAIFINCILAVFNMIPIPPLDGGRVLTGLLPTPLAIKFARLERFGMLVLIGLIFILPMIGRQLGYELNVISYIVLTPVYDVLLPFYYSITTF
ncbi:MAG: site-2 protease family protein [Halopseudomonas aestusnigri]